MATPAANKKMLDMRIAELERKLEGLKAIREAYNRPDLRLIGNAV